MPEIPVEVLLSWPKPNYVNPVTRGPGMLAVSCIFLPLSMISVSLRIYRRTIQANQFGWDDGLIVLAFIFTFSFTVPLIIGNHSQGLDRHVWDIPYSKIPVLLKYAFAAKVTMSLAGNFTRMSLVCFYFRLIKDSNSLRFTWILRVSLVILICHMFVFLIPSIFICNPIRAYWAFPRVPGAKCLDEASWSIAAGISSCFMDLLVTALPIPLILQLSMSARKRIVIIVLMNLGLLATIAGAVKVVYVWRSLVNSYDTTWEGYGLWIAGTIEVNIGVFCACVPTLRCLFGQWFGPGSSVMNTRITKKFGQYRTRVKSNNSNKSANGSINYRNNGHGGFLAKSDLEQSIDNNHYPMESIESEITSWEKG